MVLKANRDQQYRVANAKNPLPSNDGAKADERPFRSESSQQARFGLPLFSSLRCSIRDRPGGPTRLNMVTGGYSPGFPEKVQVRLRYTTNSGVFDWIYLRLHRGKQPSCEIKGWPRLVRFSREISTAPYKEAPESIRWTTRLKSFPPRPTMTESAEPPTTESSLRRLCANTTPTKVLSAGQATGRLEVAASPPWPAALSNDPPRGFHAIHIIVKEWQHHAVRRGQYQRG